MSGDYAQMKQHLKMSKIRSREHEQNIRNNQINKSNQVLLKNLTEITKGKRVSLILLIETCVNYLM